VSCGEGREVLMFRFLTNKFNTRRHKPIIYGSSSRKFNKRYREALEEEERIAEAEGNPMGDELTRFTQGILEEYSRLASTEYLESIYEQSHRQAHSNIKPPWEED
jgi:hypothetical protein